MPARPAARRAPRATGSYPDLPDWVAAAVEDRTGERVAVTVEYVERALAFGGDFGRIRRRRAAKRPFARRNGRTR